MTGPKRLWSGDWLAESAAQRERVAGQRAAAGVAGAETPEAVAAPSAVARPSLRERVLRAWAGLAAARPGPGGLRVRLLLIAVLAGAAGAAAMVGVEAATGAGGTPARPYLGVELGPPVLGQSGAVVEFVYPNGPAQAAGVMVGDVITAVDGHAVTGATDAVAAIGALSAGSSATLTVDRLGAPMTITVTLGSRTAGSP